MERWQAIRIAIAGGGVASVYAILHDQMTAWLCAEWFSLAHPPVFATRSPALIALGWGLMGSACIGLPLGAGLALAARFGSPPWSTLSDLRRPIAGVFLATALTSLLIGGAAAWLVAKGDEALLGVWAALVPRARQPAFAFDLWAHGVSCGVGAAGGAVVIAHTLWRRLRLSASTAPT